MPARRSTHVASRQAAPARLVPARGTTASDMIGLAVVVAAVAMATTLLMPTSAPVASAMGQFLTLSFGRAALLVPVALLLFSGTFFLEDGPLGSRVALGLALVVVALLGLVSLNIAGDATTAELVIDAAFVGGAGGYVGGGVAWACLTLVGRGVGNVLVCGLLAAGVVVCGFSISDAVTRVRGHARDAGERIGAVRELLRTARGRRRKAARATHSAGPDLAFDDAAGEGAAATTFLGLRTTSVITRDDRVDSVLTDVDEMAPVTSHPDTDGDTTASTAAEGELAPTAIPDFLRRPTEALQDAPAPLAPASESVAPKRARRQRSSRAKAAPTAPARPGERDDAYKLPPFSMLSSNPNSARSASSATELDDTMVKLQATLAEFGLASRVVGYVAGPLVTTFHIEMGEGERVSRITNLEDDIALTLAAESVRIFAPIPGTSRVGIEIPNKARQNVRLGDVLPSAAGGPLEFALGRDAEGRPVTADLATMPHLLVAGATGSGKSVMINSLIMSLLMRTTPRQVRLILVDPKRVEFSGYNGLPHLYVPVVTEPRQAASALAWAVSEMERRLKVFERAGARNIAAYNEMCISGKLAETDDPPEPMPLMVIIIDELADLMMVAGKDVEASIVRIAQLARAAGIHLVLATQRPSANVVTGLIKSNIETRVALSVASGTDSRVILDATGAQRLLGNGDMLFKARGNRTRRVLGCYVSDPEIESVVDFIRDQAEPDYHEEILTVVVPNAPGEAGAPAEQDDDPLVWEAARIVVESQLGSTSGLQRRLKVGYARAGRIMDMLESKGVVGPSMGSKPRDVLLDEEGLEELRGLEEQYREV